jgi:hypothetical protein
MDIVDTVGPAIVGLPIYRITRAGLQPMQAELLLLPMMDAQGRSRMMGG